MKKKEGISLKEVFYSFSAWVTKATGKPATFLIALLIVIAWAVSGPFFHYSETWQLVINTGTTIITFLMIFVIHQSQKRDTAALHLKLNELIATNKDTSNRLVASEGLTRKNWKSSKNIIRKYQNIQTANLFLHRIH